MVLVGRLQLGFGPKLAIIGRLEAGGPSEEPERERRAAADLRREADRLVGLLEFQELMSQQLADATRMLAAVEKRVETLADLLGSGLKT